MHFEIAETDGHDVYNLLIGLVAPRPIALVTTLNSEGVLNAAPFSAYNYMGTDPPIIAFGPQNRPGPDLIPKDTARNIRLTGEFVVNIVDEVIAEAMNICCIDFPPGVNELEKAGLTTAPSTVVKVPRIAEAPAALECREIITIERGRSRVVLGEVVAIYVRDTFIDPKGPYVIAETMHAIGRMNGHGLYVRTRDATFTMPRPTLEDWKKQHGQQAQQAQ